MRQLITNDVGEPIGYTDSDYDSEPDYYNDDFDIDMFKGQLEAEAKIEAALVKAYDNASTNSNERNLKAFIQALKDFNSEIIGCQEAITYATSLIGDEYDMDDLDAVLDCVDDSVIERIFQEN